MGGGSPAPASQTVTQVKDIPQWAQDAGQQNYQLAESIASQPYQAYQGQLIAGFTPQQTQGMQMAGNAATAYQPDLNAAQNATYGAQQGYTPYQGAATNQINRASSAYQPALNASAGMEATSAQPWNANAAQQYMSPYAQAALAPQIQQEQIQLGQQQLATNANATEAGAFGDARNGVANSLNNYYGNQNLANIEATGMNTAYNTGLGAYQQQQTQQLNAGSALGQNASLQSQLPLNAAAGYGTLGSQAANLGLQTGNQLAGLGAQQQTLGETGAQAEFGAGTQQQQLTQQQLTTAYQNFMNQTLYPTQGLNERIAALGNTPYTQVNYQNPAPANATANNLNGFGQVTNMASSLLSGNKAGASATAPGNPNTSAF